LGCVQFLLATTQLLKLHGLLLVALIYLLLLLLLSGDVLASIPVEMTYVLAETDESLAVSNTGLCSDPQLRSHQVAVVSVMRGH
jgi:hypothetical protein